MSITVGTYIQIIPARLTSLARGHWQGRTGVIAAVNNHLNVVFANFSGEEGCFRFDQIRKMDYAPAARRKYTNLRIKDTFDQTYVLEDAGRCNGVLTGTVEENRYKAVGVPVYFSQGYLNERIESGDIKILGVGNAPVITKAANDDVYEDVVIAAKKYSQLEKCCVYTVHMNNNKEGYFTHVRKVDVGAWLCVSVGSGTFESTQTISYRDKGTRWFFVKEKDLTMEWLIGDDYATFTPANEWPSMSDGLENSFSRSIEGNY